MQFLKIEIIGHGYVSMAHNLVIRMFTSILEIKGSNLISGVCVVNTSKLIEYSFI
jgi:hypothetical protein